MELKITSEKVLEAASKCSTAKDILATMFPEVFKEDKYFNLKTSGMRDAQVVYENEVLRIELGAGAAPQELVGKCFYLGSTVNWELREDNYGGMTLLTPTKKQ